jgi:hypothetical protein
MIEHIAIILSAFFTLISGLFAGWIKHNQTSKEKMTDFKIEQLRRESEEKMCKNNRHTAVIYGELWRLLNLLNADRCFILQPHPKKKYLYISVVLEVDKKGISMVKELIQSIPLSDIPLFSKQLSINRWLYFDNIDEQATDSVIKSLMSIAGSTNIGIKQLVNVENDWIGSLVIENTGERPLTEGSRELMRSVANTIQYILPPIN